MAELIQSLFTARADDVAIVNLSGVFVDPYIDALAGNDRLRVTNPKAEPQYAIPASGEGLYLTSSLLMGRGNDLLEAVGPTTALVVSGGFVDLGVGNDTLSVLSNGGNNFESAGLRLVGGARLLLGAGNDRLIASGSDYGVSGDMDSWFPIGTASGLSILDVGAGNDVIEANGGNGVGIDAYYLNILMGDGNDVISASAASRALMIESSLLDLGSGRNEVTLTSTFDEALRGELSSIRFGDGKDVLTGFSGNDAGMGLSGCDLNMGGGNNRLSMSSLFGYGSVVADTVISFGGGKDVFASSSSDDFGTFVAEGDSRVLMGGGDDLIDFSSGQRFHMDSFLDNNYISLGDGKDVLRGFGTAKVDAGSGRDKLFLPAAIYTVEAASAVIGSATVSGFNLMNGGATLFVSGMEQVGYLGGRRLVDLQAGILEVRDDGRVLFAS